MQKLFFKIKRGWSQPAILCKLGWIRFPKISFCFNIFDHYLTNIFWMAPFNLNMLIRFSLKFWSGLSLHYNLYFSFCLLRHSKVRTLQIYILGWEIETRWLWKPLKILYVSSVPYIFYFLFECRFSPSPSFNISKFDSPIEKKNIHILHRYKTPFTPLFNFVWFERQ